MGRERTEVSLDDVYDFRSGLSKARYEFGSGYPFLTFKDVFYNVFVPDELGDLVNSTVTCPPKTGPDVELYSGLNLIQGGRKHEEERIHPGTDHQYAQGS